MTITIGSKSQQLNDDDAWRDWERIEITQFDEWWLFLLYCLRIHYPFDREGERERLESIHWSFFLEWIRAVRMKRKWYPEKRERSHKQLLLFPRRNDVERREGRRVGWIDGRNRPLLPSPWTLFVIHPFSRFPAQPPSHETKGSHEASRRR